jgi:hypothetical protein
MNQTRWTGSVLSAVAKEQTERTISRARKRDRNFFMGLPPLK